MHQQSHPRSQHRPGQDIAGIVYPQVDPAHRDTRRPEGPRGDHVPPRIRQAPRRRDGGRHTGMPGRKRTMSVAWARLLMTVGPRPHGMVHVRTRSTHGALCPQHDPVCEALRQRKPIGSRSRGQVIGESGPQPRGGNGSEKDRASSRMCSAQGRRNARRRVAVDEREPLEVNRRRRTGRLRTERRGHFQRPRTIGAASLGMAIHPAPPQHDQHEEAPKDEPTFPTHPLQRRLPFPLFRLPPLRRLPPPIQAQSLDEWPT